MGNIGFREILIILVIILILFGAKRIPEVMKAFGKGIREFKKGASDLESQMDEDEESSRKDDKPSPPVG